MKTSMNTEEVALFLHARYNSHFTPGAARALAEYLAEQERTNRYEIEFSGTNLVYAWRESPSLKHWARWYFRTDPAELQAERGDDYFREFIRERGELIEFNGGVLVDIRRV